MSNYYTYLRNENSGEVHRVVMDGTPRKRWSVEGCNLDSAKELDEFESEAEAVEYVEKAGGSWCTACCWAIADPADLTFPGDAAESETNTA